jgi:hypothetical protein
MRRVVVLATVVAALSIPSLSAAQSPSSGWFASPFVSASFGGDTTESAPFYVTF